MRFKVGDKVKPTKKLLLKLPSYVDRIKDGGKIINILTKEAEVKFYSGCTYHIYFSSLELVSTKNQQLLFDFMND